MAGNNLVYAQGIKKLNREYLHSIPGVHTVFTTVINNESVIVVQSQYPTVIPSTLNGVKTLFQIAPAPKLATSESPLPRAFGIRPLPAGCLINPSVSLSPTSPPISSTNWWGGTAGLILTKGTDKYILSCSHAFKEGTIATPNSPIWQPDNTSSLFKIAELYKYIPLLAPPSVNTVDYSLLKVLDPNQVIDHIYHLTPFGSPVLLENYIQSGISILDTVYKSGVKTGISEAVVFTIDASFSAGGDSPTLYDDMVGAFGNGCAAPGDSGSAVFEGNGYFAGILTAGAGFWLGFDACFFCKAQHIIDSIGNGYYFTPHKNIWLDEPTPTFSVPVKLSLSVIPPGAGTTDPPIGTDIVQCNINSVLKQTQVNFYANSGYKYDHYQTDLHGVGSNNPSPFIPITADIQIQAIFVAQQTDTTPPGTIVYSNPVSVNVGDSVQVNLSYSYTGLASNSDILYASLGKQNGSAFTELASTGIILNNVLSKTPTKVTRGFTMIIPSSLVGQVDFKFKITMANSTEFDSPVYTHVLDVISSTFSNLIITNVTKS